MRSFSVLIALVLLNLIPVQAKAYVQQTCTFVNGYGNDHTVKTLILKYSNPRIPSYQILGVSGGVAATLYTFDIRRNTYDGPSKGYEIYKIDGGATKFEGRVLATLYVYPENSPYFPGQVHLRSIEVLDENERHIAYYHATNPCVTIWKADTIW